jgi:hypothetical protein
MLIGEEKINAVFDSWLEKNGFDTRVCGLHNEFSYGESSDTIAYSIVHPTKFVTDFVNVCNSLGLAYEIDIFWLSFLHELGHAETLHLVSDADFWEAELLDGLDYYFCNREIYATRWAVDFINRHIDLVIDLMQAIKPVMIEFYQINGIEGE